MLSQEQLDIYDRAVGALVNMTGADKKAAITLYGPNGKPLAPGGQHMFRRAAAKRTGSMKNWVPRRLISRTQEAAEREFIVARASDLVNNDPHAAGILNTIAYTVVGSGLNPQPLIDLDAFPDIDKDKARRIQIQMRNIYKSWAPSADAAGRMTFGAIQFLIKCNLLQYGEYLVLLPMLDDAIRPYSIACQILNPLRLKTPLDKINQTNIRDGVELGEYGEAVAYWIKKSDPANPMRYWADISDNFMRIPRKKGHRWNVLHGFVTKEAEQVRGMPIFAPAMKQLRDISDYLDAELVSNIVTAAFSLWIETGLGENPMDYAEHLASRTEQFTNPDNNIDYTRYQEMIPGQIYYGEAGQKAHVISATRPGQTFEPFTKLIKKTLALAVGYPYPVLFKDVEGVNFAGFRSAMLDAWRVFMTERTWLGAGFAQPIYTMLMEEAWLRDQIDIDDFYESMHALTHAEWRGSPKGDIEPIKAINADVIAIKNKLKTRAQAIAEREGTGDWRAVFDQLEEEEEELAARGLNADLDTSASSNNAANSNDEKEAVAMDDLVITEASHNENY